MTRTAFISASFQHREQLHPALSKIADVLKSVAIVPKIFVNDYRFEAGEETRMMNLACQEIAQSDFVIAEVSHKAIGIGVEVGYAVGLGKPVIYLRHVDAEHSTIVAGISTYQIVYGTVEDLAHQLTNLLRLIL